METFPCPKRGLSFNIPLYNFLSKRSDSVWRAVRSKDRSPLSERMKQAIFYTRLQEVTSLKEPFDVLVSLPSVTNSKRTIL